MELTFSSRMYSIFHQALCYVLLAINLTHISKEYFSFHTDTGVGFYSPINITLPNVSLCLDLNTIVRGYEPMMFYPRSAQYVGKKDRFLFSRVPGVDKILKKCARRDAEMDQLEYALNGSACLALFDVKR